jgi:hypothetical protein
MADPYVRQEGFPTRMKQRSLADLEAYARRRIAAERYPGDYHRFRVFGCDSCGVVPLELTIEHHTGARKGNFRGVIYGRCKECGGRKRVFSFTGEHREPVKEERPVCRCGNASFLVGECERIERDEGVLGFFDEGVVVGMCAACGRKRVMVETD